MTTASGKLQIADCRLQISRLQMPNAQSAINLQSEIDNPKFQDRRW
jgi:hypothetical protein